MCVLAVGKLVEQPSSNVILIILTGTRGKTAGDLLFLLFFVFLFLIKKKAASFPEDNCCV